MCKTKILICAFLILRSALLQASNIQQASTPTGPAGGALTGTYPNPTLTGVTSLGAIAVGSSTTGVLSQVALGSAGAMLYAGASGPAYTSTSDLVWDQINKRLGLGTASPSDSLTVTISNSQQGITIQSATAIQPTVRLQNTGSGFVGSFRLAGGSSDSFQFGGGLGLPLGTIQFGTDIMAAAANPYIEINQSRIRLLGPTSVGQGNSSTATLNCSNRTATTGSTSCEFQAGPGQSGNVLRVLNNAGTEVFGINSTGRILAADGSAILPTYGFSSVLDLGLFLTGGNIGFVQGANVRATFGSPSTGFRLASDMPVTWTSGAANCCAPDTGISRNAAGVLEVNNGTAGTFGGLRASYVQSSGTTFTASGCSVSALTGGATAGRYTSGTTGACTVTVTMGNSATATNGWSCYASNRTTANLMRQTATTTTTATFDGTTVSGDVISFGCIGN